MVGSDAGCAGDPAVHDGSPIRLAASAGDPGVHFIRCICLGAVRFFLSATITRGDSRCSGGRLSVVLGVSEGIGGCKSLR